MPLDLRLGRADQTWLDGTLSAIKTRLIPAEEILLEVTALIMLLDVLSTYSVDVILKNKRDATQEQIAFAEFCQNSVIIFNELREGQTRPEQVPNLWQPSPEIAASLTRDDKILCQNMRYLYTAKGVDHFAKQAFFVVSRMLELSKCRPFTLQQFLQYIQARGILKPEQFRYRYKAEEALSLRDALRERPEPVSASAQP